MLGSCALTRLEMMASSFTASASSAIALCCSHPLPTRRRSSSHTQAFLRNPPYPSPLPRFLIRCIAAEQIAGTPPDPRPPPTALDTSPPSLLTSSNILKAFLGKDLTTPDHYATLGVVRGASYEEVRKAFRDKRESILQQGSNEDVVRNKLRTLKDSYDVLSSKEQRRLYDWSLLQAESTDGTYRWPYEADITQKDSDLGPPRDPEDDEGTRMVGYFFLGWLILSFILSLVLK